MKKGRITGAKAVIKTLEELGVEIIFGYPGGANLPLYDALERSSIKHVLVRHEQGAAHMADGYARATGRVGVCLATSGPGATNLITGIATAYMDSYPVLAITGQVGTGFIGTDAFQEVDITGITNPVTKHNLLVQNTEELVIRMKEAFHLCETGRKGPVLIDIPQDILKQEFTLTEREEIVLEGYNPTTEGHPGQIRRGLKLLEKAEKPLIIVGGGIALANAYDELREFVDKTQIPLIYTFMGKSALGDKHPCNLGMCGYHGKVVSNQAIDRADVILALGVRFSNRHTVNLNTYPGHKKIIHVDIDPAEIGKSVEMRVPIVGDVKQILKRFNAQMKTPPINAEEKAPYQTWKKELQEIDEKSVTQRVPSEGLSEPLVLRNITKFIENPLIVTDVGRHQMFAAHEIDLEAGRNFLSSGGLGTMGFSLPAAIGAVMGEPERSVVVVAGDGSFVMNCQEMLVASEQELNLIILIMNDGALGMITQLQDRLYDKRFNISPLKGGVSFPKMAESMGCIGHQVESLEEFGSLMSSQTIRKGTHLVDCLISHPENAYPMTSPHSILDQMEEEE